MWMQIVPLSATASKLPCCKTATVDRGTMSCCGSDCCMAHPSPNSKPTPAVPTQSGIQNQILLLSSGTVIWTLPKNETPSCCPTGDSSLTDAIAPLYARHCPLLL